MLSNVHSSETFVFNKKSQSIVNGYNFYLSNLQRICLKYYMTHINVFLGLKDYKTHRLSNKTIHVPADILINVRTNF